MGGALNKLVFQPPEATYGNDRNLLWLVTKSGSRIPAFFINRGVKLTLLFSHGNAEDLGMIVNYFKEVSATWKVNVFAYEYTGYGVSVGRSPSEAQVYEDAEAAYQYLTTRLGVRPNQIVIYGRSLGSGPSCHLALKHREDGIRGLILQSPLMSIHRIAVYPRFTLPGDLFPNIDKIGKISCPTFILHGSRDEVIPFRHGVELYNACPAAVTPFWIEGGSHNDLEAVGKHSFFSNVHRFLRFLENSYDSEDDGLLNSAPTFTTTSSSSSSLSAGCFPATATSGTPDANGDGTARQTHPRPSSPSQGSCSSSSSSSAAVPDDASTIPPRPSSKSPFYSRPHTAAPLSARSHQDVPEAPRSDGGPMPALPPQQARPSVR